MPKTNRNIREELLSNAFKLLNKTDFEAFNMRLLAKESNVALGTIYNYFQSKFQIVTELVALLWEDCLIDLAKVNCDDTLNALKTIYLVVSKYLNLFQTNWLKILSSFSNESKAVGKQVEEKYFQSIKKQIRKALENKNLDIEKVLSAEQLCNFIFYNFLGMWKSQQDYATFEVIIKKIIKND